MNTTTDADLSLTCPAWDTLSLADQARMRLNAAHAVHNAASPDERAARFAEVQRLYDIWRVAAALDPDHADDEADQG